MADRLDSTGLAYLWQKLKTVFAGKADKTDTVLNTTLSHGRAANSTVGSDSMVYGTNLIASGSNSQAFGARSEATNSYAHAEGYYSRAQGEASHSEGNQTIASGNRAHAEGYQTFATGADSHTEGNTTTASATASHAEGYNTTASASYSHAEGQNASASNGCAHAEGSYTTASGQSSHAEGCYTTSSGSYSHAEGYGSKALDIYAHAEGFYTRAEGSESHAEGSYTRANRLHIGGQHAAGRFNAVSGNVSITITAAGASTWEEHKAYKAYSVYFPDTINNTGKFYVPHRDFSEYIDPITDYQGTYWHRYTPSAGFDPETVNAWDKDTLYAENSIVKELAPDGTLMFFQNHNAVTTTYYPLTCTGYHLQDENSTFTKYSNQLEIIGNGLSDNYRANARMLDENGDEFLRGDLYVQCNEVSGNGKKVVTETAVNALIANKADKADTVLDTTLSSGRKENTTVGVKSVAFGGNVTASAPYSQAFGSGTTAFAYCAYAEGDGTIAAGNSSHAEGAMFDSDGYYNVDGTVYYLGARGADSHSEGRNTSATGVQSHAEGYYSIAGGTQSHAEGDHAVARGTASHAEGIGGICGNTYASGHTSEAHGNGDHVEGKGCYADSGYASAGAHAEGFFSAAQGAASHSEGYGTWASADYSHAEGYESRASTYAHAESHQTRAYGQASHTEGDDTETTATADNSHAEGHRTVANNKQAHAEGDNTRANGLDSHAEGYGGTYTLNGVSYTSAANGMADHVEGYQCLTTNSQPGSHAEGYQTRSTGGCSHSEGLSTLASGNASHAEGLQCTASGARAHAEGDQTTASQTAAHAEGYQTTASSYEAHAEGSSTTASGTAAHAEGYNSAATADFSHAEGKNTVSSYQSSHAEGESTTASGFASHAEGNFTTASEGYAHAEGYYSEASEYGAHAEGNHTSASNYFTHAEGYYSEAKGQVSHAEGYCTKAAGAYEHVSGKYNVEDSAPAWVANTEYAVGDPASVTANGKTTIWRCNTANSDSSFDSSKWDLSGQYVFVVGNGADDNARSNAMTIDWEGNERINGDMYVGCNADSSGGSKVATESFVTTQKGSANGIAELDANGKVPSAQLPGYVDDVEEYASTALFPSTGESGKIYVALDTNKTYRWGGSEYVEISASLALGETESTAYRGDRGKAAYDHASAAGSAFASGLYKITTNSEGHVTGATAVVKSDITALGIPGQDTTYDIATTTETQAIINEYGVSA